MWSIHDDIRSHLKQAGYSLNQGDAEQAAESLKASIQAIRDMIFIEL